MTFEGVSIVLSIACFVFGHFRPSIVYAGMAFQLVYLLLRGIDLGRLPLVGPHDTLVFLAASTMIFVLPVAHRLRDRQRLVSPAAGLAVLFMGLSLLYPPHDRPLAPVLRTFWFETHVAFSFFSYALFGIAAVLGILVLTGRGNTGEKGGSSEPIESLQYRAILVGYFFFSAAMIFGGIWAFYAWGTYWLWTPKELWTVMLWLFYSLYLHARLRGWWAGKPSAILGVAGFGVVLFTYLGVSLFMKSSHTF